MKKYANMAQFAAELHLARSTVSYILNDKWKERNISPETVRRVREYAQKVHFVPNFFGRAIKGKVRSDAAILLPANAYHHHREAFFRLLSRLEQTGLKYLVLPVSPAGDPGQLLEQLIAYSVRRVLVIAAPLVTSSNAAQWRGAAAATPQIDWLFYDCRNDEFFDLLTAEKNVGAVGFDRDRAEARVCEYVRAAGYRELFCYGFIPDSPLGPDLEIRPLAPGEPAPVSGHPETAAGLGAALQRSRPSGKPCAVFIYDDLLTAGVIDWLLEHGAAVPEEFAFISWDGLDASRFFRRSLTTLAVPHERMLESALNFLTGDAPPADIRVEPVVREGESMPRAPHRSSR